MIDTKNTNSKKKTEVYQDSMFNLFGNTTDKEKKNTEIVAKNRLTTANKSKNKLDISLMDSFFSNLMIQTTNDQNKRSILEKEELKLSSILKEQQRKLAKVDLVIDPNTPEPKKTVNILKKVEIAQNIITLETIHNITNVQQNVEQNSTFTLTDIEEPLKKVRKNSNDKICSACNDPVALLFRKGIKLAWTEETITTKTNTRTHFWCEPCSDNGSIETTVFSNKNRSRKQK